MRITASYTGNGRSRFARGLLAAALAGLLGAAGSAGADNGNPDMGVVRGKDTARGTLLVGGRVLTVNDRTRLTGLDGQRIEFAEIPSYAEGESGYMVEFEVQGQGGSLEWLRVIETPR